MDITGQPHVVVTTESKGVFFGRISDYKEQNDIVYVTLENAQMAVYWSAATHGVLGLAAKGPQSESRITPIVPSLHLNKVTSIALATEEARKQWRKELWD